MVDENARSGQLRPDEIHLLPLSRVMERCGMSRSAIYAAMRTTPPTFPRAIKQGTSSRWSSLEIDAYISERIAERDARVAA